MIDPRSSAKNSAQKKKKKSRPDKAVGRRPEMHGRVWPPTATGWASELQAPIAAPHVRASQSRWGQAVGSGESLYCTGPFKTLGEHTESILSLYSTLYGEYSYAGTKREREKENEMK